MSETTDLVTIDDVAGHLNWDATQKTKYATEMGYFISAVTPVVEDITGPVVSRQFDEWYDGGSPLIVLDNTPVTQVTTVTETFGANVIRTLTLQQLDGVTPVDAYGYTIDLETGTLVRRVSGMTGPFARGRRNVHVVYTAGYGAATANVPGNIRLGALELIRVNWQPQQGGNRPPMGVIDPQVGDSMRLGFFVPNRVMELLSPSRGSYGIF